MRKLKAIGALTLAFSLAIGTVAMAAPSPTWSPVWVLTTPAAEDNSTSSATTTSSSSTVTYTSEEVKAAGAPVATETCGPLAMATLANAINADAATLASAPTVKVVKNVMAPAGYVQGTPITLTWAVAGVADGAVLFAYFINPDGTVSVAPVTVKGGYATFTVTSLRAVALVGFAPTTTAEVAGLH